MNISILLQQNFIVPNKQAEDWKEEEQLQKCISIESKCISLAALSKSVFEQTGVRLNGDTNYENQKVQLHLKERKLVEFMVSLCDLYGGSWIKKNEVFYFETDPEVIRKKESWWYAVNAERQKILSGAARQFKGAMMAHKPDWSILDSKKPEERQSYVNGLHQMQFWYDMPPNIQDQISSSFSDSYLYGRYRMAVPIISEGVPFWPLSALSDTSRESLLNQVEQSNPVVERSRITHFLVRSGSQGFYVNVIADGLGREGKGSGTASAGITLQYPDRQGFSLLTLDHSKLQDTLVQRGQRPSLYQKRLLAFQARTFWKNDLTLVKKKQEPKYKLGDTIKVEKGGPPPPSLAELMRNATLPRLPDVLGKLTPETEFIADYYSIPYRPLTAQEWEAKVQPDITVELNTVAQTYDCSWKKESEGLYLIRNNRWYREDNLEVPMKVADELETLSQQAKRVTFADPDSAEMYSILEMASFVAPRLSKWQLANGLYYYTREERVPAHDKITVPVTEQYGKTLPLLHVLSYRESNCQPYTGVAVTALLYNKTCRFYASLGYPERIRFLTTGIRKGDLNKAQQDLLLTVAPYIAPLSDTSIVRLEITKNPFSVPTPYLYGTQTDGSLPFTMEIKGEESEVTQ